MTKQLSERLSHFVNLQLCRFTIIKSMDEARKRTSKTNDLVNTCVYCISRCILQDIISLRGNEDFNALPGSNSIKKFCDQYQNTRNLHSHYFSSTKQDLPITLEKLEYILVEIHKILNPQIQFDIGYGANNPLVQLFTQILQEND